MPHLRYSILFFITIATYVFAENKIETTQLINSNKNIINQAAVTFNIDKNILKSVIYAERTLNFDWFDKALDTPTALKGYNSSIGFCQVKMKTAYWIEVQLSDSTSEFYPGKQYQNILPVSKSPREIITKLQIDSLNICYAAAYLKIIQNYWQKAGFSIKNRPDILGTLYSTGLFNRKGKIRRPNANPQANAFGKKAKEAYQSFPKVNCN